jgi:hypothetical protein
MREKVRIEWDDAQRRKLNDEFYRHLLARYEVVIEGRRSVDGAMLDSVTSRQP